MTPNKKVLVKDLNPYLTCTLCGGYFIDATALVDCLHVFCRGCILRYFENCKQGCPTCNTVYKKKNTTFFKPDTQLQTLVYKLVPGLYSKEMQRREDFYRTTGDRAGSSCSDDSVLGDMAQDHEEWISSYVGDNNQFYSPEDSISLSLEYYQSQLDTTGVNSTTKVKNSDNKDGDSEAKKDADVSGAGDSDEHLLKNDRRYLQCPAAVTMSHLQKFVRMKFGLTSEHKVDIIYAGEVLPQHFTLMDVAYTFRWSRTKPMRFFYRIFVFTPMKVVRPIKIITTSSSNGKQLQIVPVKPGIGAVKPEVDAAKPNIVPVTALPQSNKPQESEENYTKKEKMLANLQLLSKDRFEQQQQLQQQLQQQQKQKKKEEESCVYEYEEPDKEEIKRFAEKRDREWALQKHLDEQQEETRHVSKKRKKNKHSKNESVHKKRKLHAEITSNEVLTKEESLKLKVKLTPHNGHKHKHHKQAVIEAIKPPPPPAPPVAQEQSSKEKLLQMRAVRHKHVNNDEKTVVAEKPQVEKPVQSVEVPTKKETPPPPPPEKTLRSDITVKTSTSKELAASEQTRKVTILKTFQSHPEKSNNNNNNKVQEKVVPPVKIETKKPQILNSKLLERKIANLKQQCTIGPKKDNTKLVLIGEKQQYNTGFTVSKIEAGVKRKAPESEEARDKRPSLEITLINPSSNKAEETKTKRPPPATIPLERIKKSISFKSGISIIPKLPERCDNIGALDLSKPSTTHNGVTVTTAAKLNNCVAKKPPEKTAAAAAAVHMSNLQMLSKVALEHPTLNKQQQQGGSGGKPKLPNLQTLKTPTPPAQQKSLPKLNEINKTQFRLVNSQVRNMRPNQSQNVRNIPNPSLLVRQQTQNRLNSSSINQNGGDSPKEPPPAPPAQPKTNTTVATTAATTTAVTTATATDTAKQ